MAISSIIQGYGEEHLLAASNLVGEAVPWQSHIGKRYNLDIDGNSSSWQGLFMKLLAGGVVLKVTSPHGFRQWYYDRLMPWVNFVPVCSDLSDIIEAVDRLRSSPKLAREIAGNGRKLALAMTIEAEIKLSAKAFVEGDN